MKIGAIGTPGAISQRPDTTAFNPWNPELALVLRGQELHL